VENPALTNAAWWYWFWELIGTISFFGVVVALAVEFGAARLSAPYREILDNAREERISAANERAAKAELELAKFKAPRMLSLEQQAQIADKLKAFAGTLYDAGIGPAGDPEPLYLLRSIHAALSQAGWVQIAWTEQGAQTYTEPPMPAVGLTMVTNVIIDVNPNWWVKYGPAATALAAALAVEGIAAIPDSQPTSINSDAIHVRIGRKL